jgi:hypothetical protein
VIGAIIRTLIGLPSSERLRTVLSPPRCICVYLKETNSFVPMGPALISVHTVSALKGGKQSLISADVVDQPFLNPGA